MEITEHFDSDEFAQPARHGIPGESYPDEWLESRLKPLCGALETIRSEIGAPLRILSGYRSVEYNRAVYEAVGQPPTDSQHSKGNAADIMAIGVKAEELHETTLRLYKEGKIRIGGLGKYNTFIHVDIRPNTGHLAQWDNSTTAGSNPDSSGGQSFESGEGEGDEEDADTAGSTWYIALAIMAVGIIIAFIKMRHG